MLVSRVSLTVLLLAAFVNSSAQNMSHEEEVVRNAYAKLSFMCELVPVYEAGFDRDPHTGGDGPRRSDLAALHMAIATATPVFSLTGFQTGPISDIANQPVSQFITLPTPHDQVLKVQLWSQGYNYSGTQMSWTGAKVKWVNSNSNGYPFDQYLTVSQAIQKKQTLWTDQSGVTFTRYAAFTVDATFQGKSSGPHRAIFFFGDASGKEVIAPNDPISGPSSLLNIRDIPAYPIAFLASDVRDVPVVAAWVRSHEISSASCSAKSRMLCCSGGRCGISQTDLNRDLSMPLPKAKTPGGGQ